MSSVADRLPGLIGRLYDAALDPGRFEDLAPAIADCFGSSSAVLKVHGPASRVDLVEVTDNLVVPDREQDWADYWHRHDIWVDRSAAFGMSKVVIGEELLPRAEFEATGFYQDWNRRIGIYHMIGAVFPVDPSSIGVLGVHRDRSTAGYGDPDRSAVEAFLPHLQRALRLREQLGRARLVQQAADQALETLAVGALVVDAHRRLLYANPAAERLLNASDEIGVAGGRVGLADGFLDARFARLVRDAATVARGEIAPAPHGLAIPREGHLPLTISIAPLSEISAGLAGTPGGVLLLLRDPERPQLSTTLLRRLFGLTPAEATVTAALVEGLSVAEIAARLGVGLGTIRTHVKSALHKTGSARQAQLVALAARSIAASGPG